MSMILSDIEFKINSCTFPDIVCHLRKCQDAFIPPLNNSVDINEYAEKLFALAVRFEAWDRDVLIGLVATYFNDEINKHGFITNVSVEKEYNGRGIAKALLQNCLEYSIKSEFRKVSLKVNKSNLKAFRLYKQLGFTSERSNQIEFVMYKTIDDK